MPKRMAPGMMGAMGRSSASLGNGRNVGRDPLSFVHTTAVYANDEEVVDKRTRVGGLGLVREVLFPFLFVETRYCCASLS